MPVASSRVLTRPVLVGLAVATVLTATIVTFGYRYLVFVPSLEAGSTRVETFSDLEVSLLATGLYSLAGAFAMVLTVLFVRWRRPKSWGGIVAAAVTGPAAIAVPGLMVMHWGGACRARWCGWPRLFWWGPRCTSWCWRAGSHGRAPGSREIE